MLKGHKQNWAVLDTALTKQKTVFALKDEMDIKSATIRSLQQQQIKLSSEVIVKSPQCFQNRRMT